AAGATVAAGGTMARTGFMEGFGPAPIMDTITLDAAIQSGQTFTVDNPNARPTINAGSGSNVHVVATRHYSVAGQGPDVRLSPDGNGVTLGATSVRGDFPFGGKSWVDYAVQVPAGVDVNVSSNSGQVEVDGVSGGVHAQSSS